MKNLKELKKFAADKNKKVIYSRNLGGYQIMSGFFASDVVYPARNEKGRLVLDKKDLFILASYI